MKHTFFANFIDDRSSIDLLKPEKPNPMKTDLLYEPNKTVFLQTVSGAIVQLKQRLRQPIRAGLS